MELTQDLTPLGPFKGKGGLLEYEIALPLLTRRIMLTKPVQIVRRRTPAVDADCCP